MSQNYNINMKKFNGTDYDNLLPLAYNALNSNLLNGKSYEEIVGTGGENCRIAYGNYLGKGTYGAEFPNSIECGFYPLLMMVSEQSDMQHWALRGVSWFYHSNNRGNVITWGDTGVSWYYPQNDQYFSPPAIQLNEGGKTYYYVVLGYSIVGAQGSIEQKEWLITGNTTWTVPKTGKYYLELYGGGGGAWNNPSNEFFVCQGGSSCQTYDSVMLTKGSTINVSIGVGGGYSNSPAPAPNPLDSTGTTFGSYSVAGGGRATSSSGGAAAGNKGTVGGNKMATNPSSGTFGNLYGYGGFGVRVSETGSNGGPGAVYLKYLGA